MLTPFLFKASISFYIDFSLAQTFTKLYYSQIVNEIKTQLHFWPEF